MKCAAYYDRRERREEKKKDIGDKSKL